MSDYTQSIDFSAKDALASGNANKVAKGADIDTELALISTAIATKYDSNDLATQGQAEALTSNAVLLTPHTLNDVLVDNGGLLSDIQALSDPGADRILFWDDSDGAVEFLSIGDGLDLTGNTLSLPSSVAGTGLGYSSGVLSADLNEVATETSITSSDLIIMIDATDNGTGKISFPNFEGALDHDALTNFDSDEHVAHSGVDITAGTALTGGGSIDSSRTLNVDISGLTNMSVDELAAGDSVMVNDGGTMKQMDIEDMGVRVVELSVVQTFALADGNSLQLLAGTTDRIWTIPANSSVAFPVGACIYVGSRDTATLSISPAGGVTLTSVNASGNSDQDVTAGGMAALVKVATNEWLISGDIS